MKIISSITLLMFILLYSIAGSANPEYKVYGAIKASIDSTSDGADTDLSVSNNSTRVGLKGQMDTNSKLAVVYQIELGVDVTERSKIDSGRNSYIGVKGDFGKFLIGQHDTPLKDVRIGGTELFNDTLAGSRSIISAVADAGGAKIDNRVKNAIMYYSPKMAGTQVFLLYSADNSKTPASPDDNDADLSGASVTYKAGGFYIGVGLENKSNPGSVDTEAVRLATSYKFNQFQVGGVIESADNGDNDSLTRDAIALNTRYFIDKTTWAGIQIAKADSFDGSSNTGATNISVGVEHKLAKPTTVFLVISSTNNDAGASFGLSQGGVQDAVTAANPGDQVRGLSVGMVHKF